LVRHRSWKRLTRFFVVLASELRARNVTTLVSAPEMLNELHVHSSDRKIPAILMSAVDRHETAEALGVSFLQKPFTLDQLQPLLEQLL
jgi:CheY-like chemotaxis protein